MLLTEILSVATTTWNSQWYHANDSLYANTN